MEFTVWIQYLVQYVIPNIHFFEDTMDGLVWILPIGQVPPSEPTSALATAAAGPAALSGELDTSKVNADGNLANGTGRIRTSMDEWKELIQI